MSLLKTVLFIAGVIVFLGTGTSFAQITPGSSNSGNGPSLDEVQSGVESRSFLPGHPNPPTDVPIDGGVSLLIGAGVALGARKVIKNNKGKNS
ncbi:hypothetical protein FUAX_47200 (plasmid) [Fulvitalea axinellae]|uniref:Uncharacterized protein n=1 Tax=Fulvitalea axinellae TaxID=1182444 RepID=A0AAU9CWC3_9BACT|nr:hypothetical protein FUAX_47200 [Fulvitalea axinellae]